MAIWTTLSQALNWTLWVPSEMLYFTYAPCLQKAKDEISQYDNDIHWWISQAAKQISPLCQVSPQALASYWPPAVDHQPGKLLGLLYIAEGVNESHQTTYPDLPKLSHRKNGNYCMSRHLIFVNSA